MLAHSVSFLMMIEISKLSQQSLLERLRDRALALAADVPTPETVLLFARRRFNNTSFSCITELRQFFIRFDKVLAIEKEVKFCKKLTEQSFD